MQVCLRKRDQKEAFDWLNHGYLFSTWRAFGFKEGFISWVKLLYTEASGVVKVGGGLSQALSPEKLDRAALFQVSYTHLHWNHCAEGFTGLSLHVFTFSPAVTLSAYADDVTIFIRT